MQEGVGIAFQQGFGGVVGGSRAPIGARGGGVGLALAVVELHPHGSEKVLTLVKLFIASTHAFLVAVAAVLDAAEGGHLDAVAGDLPDVHGADDEAADVALHPEPVVRDDARREAEGGGVGDLHHRVVVVRHADDRDDRAEGLLHHQRAFVRDVVDDDGRQERALAAGVVEDFGALGLGVMDAGLEGLGGFRMDHGAEIGGGVHRVAEAEAFGAFQHQRHEAVGDAFHAEDAFDGGAALAGILGGAGDGEIGGAGEVGVGEVVADDERVVSAELQDLAFVDGLGRDHLADRHAAGEGDEVEIGVGDHLVADVGGPARDDREHFGGQARLVERVGEPDGGERGQFGRLADDAVVGGDGRRDLVADHVQRVVERGDRGDGAERLAGGEDLARLAVGGEVAGEDLAVVVDAELARQGVHVEGPAAFVERVGDRDAEFGGDDRGEFRLALVDDAGGVQQDLLALVAREGRGVGGGDGEGLAGVFGLARRDRADHLAGVGIADFDAVLRVDLAAGDAHRLVAHGDGRRGHVLHVSAAAVVA